MGVLGHHRYGDLLNQTHESDENIRLNFGLQITTVTHWYW